jgi:hypothetical protein
MSYDTGYKKSKKTDDEESSGVFIQHFIIYIGSFVIWWIEKTKLKYREFSIKFHV